MGRDEPMQISTSVHCWGNGLPQGQAANPTPPQGIVAATPVGKNKFKLQSNGKIIELPPASHTYIEKTNTAKGFAMNDSGDVVSYSNDAASQLNAIENRFWASAELDKEGSDLVYAATAQDIMSFMPGKFSIALSSFCWVGGIALAYHKDKGFWGYVGYMIAGSFIGGALGKGIDVLVESSDPKPKPKAVTPSMAAAMKDWLKRAEPYKTDVRIAPQLAQVRVLLAKNGY